MKKRNIQKSDIKKRVKSKIKIASGNRRKELYGWELKDSFLTPKSVWRGEKRVGFFVKKIGGKKREGFVI